MRDRRAFRRNLFLLLIAVMLLSTSCGKNKATTMKLIKTDGEVGVDNEKGKAVDPIDNLGLYNGYNIDTQKKSFAWIDLDDTKLTKMDEKSDVGIKKDGKKLELVVNSGGLFFNVTKPLEDDESMDIHTSTTICGIRGTCGWVGSHGDTSHIGLLDGKVVCSVTVDGKEKNVKINAKELLIVKKDGDHVTYKIKELTYKDVPGFVQVEIADEPFALEEESYTVDDFLGVYSNADGEYAREVELGSDNEGALYFRHGNSINQSYSSYEVDGNIITAAYQDITGTYTDTFTLNEDGSLTTKFGDEKFSDMNMDFAFEREINEEESRQAAYQMILDEYTEAANIDVDVDERSIEQTYKSQYPNVNLSSLGYYLSYGNPPWDLSYAYYDIDKNGADELLIGIGKGADSNIIDIYTFDGRQAVKANVHESAGFYTIYSNGMIWEYTSNGNEGGDNSTYYVFRKIAKDGYTMVTEHEYSDYYNSTEMAHDSYKDNEPITQEEFDSMADQTVNADSEVTDFDWKVLVAKHSEIDRFFGTYARDRYYGLQLSFEEGSLRCTVGSNMHGGWMNCTYTNYSVNGNELKAIREDVGGVEQTDTFILNDGGSITATFSEGMFGDGTYEVNDGSVFELTDQDG